MSDTENEDWVNVMRRTRDPKLLWVTILLDTYDIPNRRLFGGYLQVPREYLGQAWDLINRPIGEFYVSPLKLTIDDLEDDHPIFDDLNVQKKGSDEALKGEPVNLPGYEQPVYMMDVESKMLSALGFRLVSSEYVVFARFKGGGTIYRYNSISEVTHFGLEDNITRKAQGDPNASVGSYFHTNVKVPAQDGRILCHKLEGDKWVQVLPK